MAEARSVWALSSASFSEVVSRVASTSPAATVSPTAASTFLTVPDAEKAASTTLLREIVPVARKLCETSPVAAIAVT